MSHRKTITIDVDGVYHNIPTVVGGKQLTPRQAADLAVKKNQLGVAFPSLDQAVEAAKKRSRKGN